MNVSESCLIIISPLHLIRPFDRENPKYTNFETFLFHPEGLLWSEKPTLNQLIGVIKRTKDKEHRNYLKRNTLPVVELFPDKILSIDIDNLLELSEMVGEQSHLTQAQLEQVTLIN